MADGSQGVLTPAKPLSARQKRRLLESALERLLGAVDGVLEDLDTLDGDPDIERGCDDDDQCDDEGHDSDTEKDDADDEPSLGSQESDRGGTIWNQHGGYGDHGSGEGEPDGRSRSDIIKAQRRYKSPHQNVSGYIAVRAL
jgi:hypothetical protein